MRLELLVKAVETYRTSARNSPVQFVLTDIHSEEFNMIQVVGKQVDRV